MAKSFGGGKSWASAVGKKSSASPRQGVVVGVLVLNGDHIGGIGSGEEEEEEACGPKAFCAIAAAASACTNRHTGSEEKVSRFGPEAVAN
ncbi:hypothetical protein PG996_002846 [Apiospora saccharicola]|uniref:Uncharacterized protein n=1 Tax=Apiospora saccharicola TaxID=335842 RepID=A0ABR1WNJ8_9PEZI